MTATPDGWNEATLASACRVVSGATPKTGVAENWGDDVAWLTPADMSRDRSQVLRGGARGLSLRGYESCSAQIVPAGSVVVSSRAPVGYVAIAGAPLATSQGCKTAVLPDHLDSRYVYWFMVHARPDLEKRASGTTFKEISAKEFGRTVLVYPPLDEQRRIVDILEDHLSHLDAADASLRTAHDRAANLRAAQLEARFADLPRQRLRAAVARVEAGRSFGGSAAPAQPEQWGIIKVSAMTWGEFREGENKAVDTRLADPRYEIHPGDLLVSRANTTAYVGASVLVRRTRPRLLLSDKSLRLVPADGVDAAWLQLALSSPLVRRQISAKATGTKESMRNISQSALLSVEVPAASPDRQDADVRALATSESARGMLAAEVEQSLQRSSALRRSLLAAAFSGQLTGRSSDLERVEELVS